MGNVIEMCRWYGYDLDRRKPTCDKGHRASLKCHSERKDCPDYLSTGDAEEYRQRYQEMIES